MIIRPETEADRARRHAASTVAYRALVDPTAPPRKPFLFEHHFFADDKGDISGFQFALEERGYRLEALGYNPDNLVHTWSVVALKLDLLEERRILALSDEMEELARSFGLLYDGWLTRVD